MSTTAAATGWDEIDENTLIVDYWLDFLSARRDCPAAQETRETAEKTPSFPSQEPGGAGKE